MSKKERRIHEQKKRPAENIVTAPLTEQENQPIQLESEQTSQIESVSEEMVKPSE